MSAIKLFILGFLMEESMSPYDLAKLIGDNDVNEMIKVSKPAVYKNFIRLEEEGCLSSKKVKFGEMPEKTVYSITEQGRVVFEALMKRYADEEVKFYFDFNSVLINLGKLSCPKALRRLEDLESQLMEKRERLAGFRKQYSFLPLEARMIIKQHSMLTETLLEWLKEFREKYVAEYCTE